MIRRIVAIACLAAASLSLAACDPSPREQCAQAKDPAQCLQVASAGGSVSDYLTYGMAGYMLSSAINGSGQRQSVIVADPSYHGVRRPIASYQGSRDYVRQQTVTTTSTKRGLLGGTKTTTRTVSSWSGPSRPSPSGWSGPSRSNSSWSRTSSWSSRSSSFSSRRR